MKSWATIGRIAAGILVLVAFGVSSRADAAVGRTVGTYAVSSTGAATYTIPLWAPRGPNGLQPAMSLSYNSQSGDGYLGVGWSIGGLSSIYRCTKTYAQDPAPAPITLTASDVFCMDGQRLRLTGGSYGVAGSTYQTGMFSFGSLGATVYTLIAMANLEDGGGEVMIGLRAAQLARNGQAMMDAADAMQGVVRFGGMGDAALAAANGAALGAPIGAAAGAGSTTATCP